MTLENLPPAAQDTLADAAEEIYQYILNAECSHSLPMSFGDSYIKWWGRLETQDNEIIEGLEDLFEKVQAATVDDYERFVRIANGEEKEGDDSEAPFNTVFGQVKWDDLYFGDYKQQILDCITNHLTEEHRIILLPNGDWTDSNAYFDMTPDY